MKEVLVRPAGTLDAAVLRMLLPEACRSGFDEFFIATAGDPPYVAGAASYQRIPGAIESVRIHVVPGMRRRGIGVRLLAAVRMKALEWDARTLSGWINVLAHPYALDFAMAQGFLKGVCMRAVEFEAVQARNYFERFRRRLQRGSGGQRYVIRRLGDVDQGEVARLWAGQVARDPELRTDMVEQELGTGGFDDSPVLLEDGVVKGVLLTGYLDGCAWIAAEAIVPEARNTWTIAALRVAAIDQWKSWGLPRVRFDWREGINSPSKMARRLEGKPLKTMQQVVLALNP